jgi:hypothetical protein
MTSKTRELDLSFYRKVKIDKANYGNPGLHPGSGFKNRATPQDCIPDPVSKTGLHPRIASQIRCGSDLAANVLDEVLVGGQIGRAGAAV